MRILLMVIGALLVFTAVASATNPDTTWATATAGFDLPPCSTSTNVAHWEVQVGSPDGGTSYSNQANAYDAFKTAGYHALGLKYVNGVGAVFYGDCALAN